MAPSCPPIRLCSSLSLPCLSLQVQLGMDPTVSPVLPTHPSITPHPSITDLCLPHQMPSPHLSPLSLIPWGVLQVRVDSWLPQHPVILVAPEVLVVRGGPEAPGDPAAPGCPSSLSPQTAPAGPAPRGTRGRLSLPVGMRSEPGSCPVLWDSGTTPQCTLQSKNPNPEQKKVKRALGSLPTDPQALLSPPRRTPLRTLGPGGPGRAGQMQLEPLCI